MKFLLVECFSALFSCYKFEFREHLHISLALVYIHVALRSAAVAVAAFSECLVFYKSRGMLDTLKFRSAVPIVEI